MASAWGKSWGLSWGNSWGDIDNTQVVYVANTLRLTITYSSSRFLNIVSEKTEIVVDKESRYNDVIYSNRLADLVHETTISQVLTADRFPIISSETRFIEIPIQSGFVVSGDTKIIINKEDRENEQSVYERV